VVVDPDDVLEVGPNQMSTTVRSGARSDEHTHLDFLAQFPFVRRFSADALWGLEDISGLGYLPEDLAELTLGRTKRKLPLQELSRFRKLKSLYLEGQTKQIDVLCSLRSLEHLMLRSITLPGLELLQPLERLRAFELKLGGTKDISLLSTIGTLEYVELWMVKGLVDLSALAEIESLKQLFLQALRRVDRLPDLSESCHLRTVCLETMKALTDLTPLANAPALRYMALIDMPQLSVTDVACLKNHPSLREVRVGLGSSRRNAEATEMLGYPDLLRMDRLHWNG
jgi:hypothetical protein